MHAVAEFAGENPAVALDENGNGLNECLMLLQKGVQARAYLYKNGEAEAAGGYARKAGAAVEEIGAEGEALYDALEESVHAMGFPGRGIEDAYLLALLKGAQQSEKALILSPLSGMPGSGDELFSWLGAEKCLYLRQEVWEKLHVDQFLDARKHELTDRLLVLEKEYEDEARVHARLLWAIACVPAMGRWRNLTDAMLLSPVWDERFLENAVLSGGDFYERMLLEINPETAKRRMGKRALPAAFERRISDEILRISEEKLEPVHALIDWEKVRLHIRCRSADMDALGLIVQTNLFLKENEAEIEL